MLRRHLFFFLALCLSAALHAQMAPNAPVKNFKLPRFGDHGYTQWVLQGSRGIYDSAEQVRVEEMALRVYSGDERMALELSLDSPQATIRLEENRAFSDQSIRIEGANFTISGNGWEWIGETKEIVVRADTRVEFAQTISGGTGSPAAGEGKTVIRSEQLVLQTTETEYHFEFSGAVEAASGDWTLDSNLLVALADAPEGRGSEVPASGAGQLDSVRRIIAREDVVFRQGERTVRSEEAQFQTRERTALLTGTPSIEVAGAYLSGDRVESRAGEVVIQGSADAGRAQMILTDTGGLGIQGAGALSAETIVLADRITLREKEAEHEFLFHGAVEVLSGAVQLNADEMEIVAERTAQDKDQPAEAKGNLQVGEISNMQARGNVRIEQSGQVATGVSVTFYPAEERAVLRGDPRVTNGTAFVSGEVMELQPKLAIVRGKPDAPLQVELPELPDLGYSALDASQPEANDEETEPVATVIRSQLLNMIEEADQTVFRFTDTVEVTATNLTATCERLDAIAVAPDSSQTSKQGDSAQLQLKRIEAYETVRIRQEERTAEAERCTILPEEGKLVLEEKAVVNDERGRVAGYRLTLYQGQRRAVVEGGGPERERARITLPGLSEGSF